MERNNKKSIDEAAIDNTIEDIREEIQTMYNKVIAIEARGKAGCGRPEDPDTLFQLKQRAMYLVHRIDLAVENLYVRTMQPPPKR